MVLGGVAHVLRQFPHNKSDIWPCEDRGIHEASNSLLVLSDVDSFVCVCGRAEVRIITGRNRTTLVLRSGDAKLIQHVGDILFLIKVESAVLSVSSNACTQNLRNFFQVFSLEPAIKLLVEPVQGLIVIGCSKHVVHINKQSNSLSLMYEQAWVGQALLEAPLEEFQLNQSIPISCCLL